MRINVKAVIHTDKIKHTQQKNAIIPKGRC